MQHPRRNEIPGRIGSDTTLYRHALYQQFFPAISQQYTLRNIPLVQDIDNYSQADYDAALINVVVPDEFFLSFGKQPLLQMLVILVVHKSMGGRFTWIYLFTIVGFSILFGLLINAFGIHAVGVTEGCGMHSACCPSETASPSVFQIICSSLLVLFIIIALSMKFFSKFKKQEVEANTVIYTVEGMHCNHCKVSCEQSVGKVKGVASCEATPAANTLAVTGTASTDDVRKAVEQAGFEFKGVK